MLAFPLQQWMYDRALMLRYTYFARLAEYHLRHAKFLILFFKTLTY